MNEIGILNHVFFGFVSLLTVIGGVITVAAKNPIRGAMGLLTTIVGIAGMYLLLSAEFLAAIQIIVYAGAVVVLFLFVIMLLGPSATSGRDTRTWTARYLAAGVFLATLGAAVAALYKSTGSATTAFGAAPANLGSIEGVGKELFTTALIPFELSSALLLVAVVGAVAVARGKQPDPTLLPDGEPGRASPNPSPESAGRMMQGSKS